MPGSRMSSSTAAGRTRRTAARPARPSPVHRDGVAAALTGRPSSAPASGGSSSMTDQWAARSPGSRGERPPRSAHRQGRSRTCCPRRPRSRATSGRRAARRCAATGSGRARCPPRARCPAALLERLEDPLVVGRRRCRCRCRSTVMCNSDGCRAARDGHRPAVRRELHRVGQQVEHDLLEPQLVGAHRPTSSGETSVRSSTPPRAARSRSSETQCSSRSATSTDDSTGPSARPRPWTGRGSR